MPFAGDPVYASDVETIADYTTQRPLVRLIQQAAQSIPHNTNTAVTFGAGSEDIDTHNFHDVTTNPSRVKPTIAGYYRCRATTLHGSRTDYTAINGWIRKNGTGNLAPAHRYGPSTSSTQVQTTIAEAIVACDGVTDYVESVVLQGNTAAVAQSTNLSSQFSSVFEVEFLRPL